ncbi:MAG: TauD/TfdA family dioxygenase [Novosphingobium sp.]
MKMQPMSEHIGIEVSDIDLAAIDDAELAAIKDAVFQSGMVAVRGQTITPEQHIAFARRWGGIDINNYFPVNGEFAEIAEVRKAENQTTNIGGGWHTDHSYDQVPAMGSILVARELPPTGGDTLFASMGAAYDSLSAGLKATLETLKAVHSADHIYRPDGYYAQTDMADEMRGHDQVTRAVHPVVIRHPVTGRKVLYVNGAFTLHFEGWTREESLPLLNYLVSVGARAEFACRLQWQQGTVAIWDNRSTQHYAVMDYPPCHRKMERAGIIGTPTF